jgi:hypothetical protein
LGHRHAPPAALLVPAELPALHVLGAGADERGGRRTLPGRRSPRARPVIDECWLERVATAQLQLYRMSEATFVESADAAGYWVSHEPVDARDRLTIGDLVGRHAAAGIALRTLPELWPLWDSVVASTLEFSGIRLRNARRLPDR